MTAFVLDPSRSSIVARTTAKGLLGALAHDLEVDIGGMTGTGTRADTSTFALEAPVAAIRVVGVRRRGQLRRDVLSESDRTEIDRRIRDDVFPKTDRVVIEGTLTRKNAKLSLRTHGGVSTTTFEATTENEGDALVISGTANLSLRELGSRELKGPMGAFTVADRVEIVFRATFTPAP